ncbi:uncharacterized protein LOC109856186 [Pseudomyrmex gracilis]|uniref:uncharacterized protein LOC109856186 n=1 Tax=Pseudomyrmex gracilis TaxID=219809 RepID=UPI0009953821|nr:uncharacterized protein LOC109856186 [Pseudomyrmex gracilis]XP_020286770.1 uncharacterized protein LOC109856186 [Pseudomyrmex gracilis]XP_020286772.1 uncharacterized protein LOC109856186 [Pseudomyrmex gracilis]
MADKNNGEIALQSRTSRLEAGNSTENIVSSQNRNSSAWSIQRIIVSILDVINHILIIMVTVYLVCIFAKDYVISNSKYGLYSLHVILCTIGYVLLMSEAIIVLASDNILTGCLSRRANKHLHWILQVIGLILNLVGVGIVYFNRTQHFKSIHAITGLASLVIVFVVTIFGYPVWIAWKLRKFIRPVVTKFLHNFLGLAGYVIGIVSQCYGYKKKMVHRLTDVKYIDEALLGLTIVITIISLRKAFFVSLPRQISGTLKTIQ